MGRIVADQDLSRRSLFFVAVRRAHDGTAWSGSVSCPAHLGPMGSVIMAQPIHLSVAPYATGNILDMGYFGLGQGGVSSRPMLAGHVDTIRNLKPKILRLFLAEYYNVYPDHGVYRWDLLDAAMRPAAECGAGLLMSLCLKPKVLHPQVDQESVHPNDYAEWEELVCQVVRHCQEQCFNVKWWEVFNEPNAGETGGCYSHFSPEDYCTYYEHTVRGVLRADPVAKVGGPAMLGFYTEYARALLSHCRDRKVKIDFLSWHTYRNEVAVFVERLRASREVLAEYPELKCQNIVDEWNISLNWDRTDPAFHTCALAEITRQMIDHGLSASCYYHIRDWHFDTEDMSRMMSQPGLAAMDYWWNQSPYFGGLFDFQGNVRYTYFLFKLLSRLGGGRLTVQGTGEAVQGLATYNPTLDSIQVMLWNFQQQPPPARQVEIEIGRLMPGKWSCRRYLLDTSPGLVDENDRLRVMHQEIFEGQAHATLAFTLAPYAVTLLTLKRLDGPREVPAD